VAKDTPRFSGSWQAGMSTWMTEPTGRPGAVPARWDDDTDREERIMPRLDFGAVGTYRAALRRLDTWTLRSMNFPAGGRRPL